MAVSTGEEVSIAGLGSAESMSESREHRVEVAAVQNSLAHMSMPHQHQAQQQAHASQQQQQQQHPVQGGHMHDGAFDPSSHPVKAGRRTLLASPPGKRFPFAIRSCRFLTEASSSSNVWSQLTASSPS